MAAMSIAEYQAEVAELTSLLSAANSRAMWWKGVAQDRLVRCSALSDDVQDLTTGANRLQREVVQLRDEVAQLKTSLALARAVLSKVVDALGEAS